MNPSKPITRNRKRIELKSFLRDVCLPDIKAKGFYFNTKTLRAYLDGQGVPWTAATLNRYMVERTAGGFVFDAGRGWYSSIERPCRLDTSPVEKLVGELKTAFPLLDFACWSTEQLNEMLRHQLAKHVQFAYVERDAIDSVAGWLKDHGYKTYANPGKAEIKRSFSIESKTVIVLPLTTKTPHQGGFAGIEKIVVDVLADTEPFSIINISEFIDGASEIIKSQRIDVSDLMKYSARRKTDISSLVDGLLIH